MHGSNVDNHPVMHPPELNFRVLAARETLEPPANSSKEEEEEKKNLSVSKAAWSSFTYVLIPKRKRDTKLQAYYYG